MHPIKVLVAALDDDLPGMLCAGISGDPSLVLCGRCDCTGDSVRMAREAQPDAIALDLRLTGEGFARTIADLGLASTATVVAMGPVTGDALRVMNAGAGDFIHLPVGGSESDCSMFAIDAAERLKVAALGRNTPRQDADTPPNPVRLIVAAAAQGAPIQLACLMAGLPAVCPPMLVLQRNPGLSGGDYAPILAGMTGRRVTMGVDGATLNAGEVTIADASYRAVISVAGGKLVLRLTRARKNARGNTADVLFRSAAQALGCGCAGISLSGEGIEGLAELAKCGGLALLHNKHALLREIGYIPPWGLKELPVEDMAGEILRLGPDQPFTE